jgi:dTDP-4-amino-4,6-dideoxygalactose transaminase
MSWRAPTSNWLTTGPKIDEFERLICNYCGCRHGVAVSSGTGALEIAVQALGLPTGSEVITTPFTFAATSNALLYSGLVPVYADISQDTRNIDPDDIRKKITDKTKAILVVVFFKPLTVYPSLLIETVVKGIQFPLTRRKRFSTFT